MNQETAETPESSQSDTPTNGVAEPTHESEVYQLRKNGFSAREMSRKLKIPVAKVNALIQKVDERIATEDEEAALTPLEKASIELGKRRQLFLAALQEAILDQAPEDPTEIDRLVQLFQKVNQKNLVGIEEAVEYLNNEGLTAWMLQVYPALKKTTNPEE